MREKSQIGVIIKWIIVIVLIIIVGKKVVEFIHPTDVTNLVNMDKQTIEKTLGVSLKRDLDMPGRIYEYSEGVVTVDGGSDTGVAIIYIDDIQTGFHIDKRKYAMYGLHIGDAIIAVDDNMTYEHEEIFEVLDDVYDGQSTALFYCNYTKGDCLVVIYNDYSNRVVALTYFNNVNEVTEELETLF